MVLYNFLDEGGDVPWDALRYVVGQINYGGRVTDDWDRRCLMTMLSQFVTPSVLEDGYRFSQSGTYYCPAPGPRTSFEAYVDSLPDQDGPEVFGMHPNADITFLQQEGGELLEASLMMQPRSSGAGGGKSADEVVAELAAAMEGKVPASLEEEEAGENTFIYQGEHMDSLATVLKQEMARYNKLLGVLRRTLAELQRAIRGEVLMSEELDTVYGAIHLNRVPGPWEAVAYPSLKPLASWVADLEAKVAFMRRWLRDGRPTVFWLAGFFFPQGFSTGALQNYSRKYQVPIDTLGFAYKVLAVDKEEEVAEEDVPDDGVLVSGLFLDGGRWNKERRTLEDPAPGELHTVRCRACPRCSHPSHPLSPRADAAHHPLPPLGGLGVPQGLLRGARVQDVAARRRAVHHRHEHQLHRRRPPAQRAPGGRVDPQGHRLPHAAGPVI